MKTKVTLLSFLALTIFSIEAQKKYVGLDVLKDTTRTTPPLDKKRPIAMQESLFMKDMTWMEIRDLIAKGNTTAIIMTGGLEMNGPYMITDKHNIIGKNLAAAIASKLGNTLVATVVPYVPEGNLEPASGLIKYPGTIGVSKETFKSLIKDIATSLKHHGFKEIILLGDSGGNQEGLAQVARQLNYRWNDNPKMRYIPEFYGYDTWINFQEKFGIIETSEGIHDIFRDTALLVLDNENHIRKNERTSKGLYTINGVDLSTKSKITEVATAIFNHQVTLTIQAIIASRKTTKL